MKVHAFSYFFYILFLSIIVTPSDEEMESNAERDYSGVGSEEKSKIEKISKMLEEMDKDEKRVKEIFTDTCIICLDKIYNEEYRNEEKNDTKINEQNDTINNTKELEMQLLDEEEKYEESRGSERKKTTLPVS